MAEASGLPDSDRRADMPEGPKSVALTVAWMMCTLATGAALALYAMASLALPRGATDGQQSSLASAIPAVALFTAVVTGGLVFGLVPIVYRIRPMKPPLPITIGSLLIAATPWVLLAVNAFPSATSR